MTVFIENEADMTFDFDLEEAAEAVIREALRYEHCPYEADVSLTITDNEGIHEINREFRNIDAPTDVLSFPMAAFDIPADFGSLEDSPDVFDPDTGELMLGDIMISGEKAAEQAEAYGHSLKREVCFLIAHSMLHLMGYDHEEEAERLLMEKKQAEILSLLGINR